MGDYGEYLRSQHWQNVRRKRLSLDGYKCVICGGGENLNVHHLTYERRGNENIEEDVVTLCHPCHAMLHRIKELSSEEYAHINDGYEYSVPNFYKKLVSLMCVEIWMRDKANGGDVKVWNSGGKMCWNLVKYVRFIYRDQKIPTDLIHTIHDTLRIAKAMKICELYRQFNNIEKVAEIVDCNGTNVQKVLKRHGFNYNGKIK